MKKGAFTRRWFKPIPDFPGYWINRAGKVWSEKTRRFLAWHLNTKWYPRVSFYHAGRRLHMFVHRLVAMVFHKNPDPDKKTEVNHLDYDTQNPYFKNLQWVTPLENRIHKRLKSWATQVYSNNPADENYCPF